MEKKLLSTGEVRKIDGLGWIVIPVKLRKDLKIKINDPLEMFVNEDQIILQKYSTPCTFCGSIDSIIDYKNKKVCKDCFNELLTVNPQGTDGGEIND